MHWGVIEKLLPTFNILVGASLGFWLGYWRDRRKAKQELESLAKLLGAEVFLETIKLKQTLSQYGILHDKITSGDSKVRVDHVSDETPTVYSANLSRIPSLPPKL